MKFQIVKNDFQVKDIAEFFELIDFPVTHISCIEDV